MPKFFVPPGTVQGGFLTLSGENAAHARVLRLKNGDSVTVCDGSGTDYVCTVSDAAPGCISLVVDASGASRSEPDVQCSVFMAFSKADKFEHVIQKATELGAVKIVAFPSARCVSRPDKASLGKKLERWQKIAASAAGQCGRGVIPQVLAADSYEQALSWAAQSELDVLSRAVRDILQLALRAFREKDTTAAGQVEPLEQVIDALKEQMRTRHILRMRQGQCSIETGFVWCDLLTDLERTSDHCSNIAGCVIDAAQHNLNLHETLHNMHHSDGEYRRQFDACAEIYRLPPPEQA